LRAVGSSSICVLLGRADGQHACPQQFDTGTAVHCPLECLRSVDLTFGLASFTADGTYDQDRVYEAVAERHPDAGVIVPPRAGAVTSASARPLRHSATATCG
jgi:hypothetical protein